MGGIFGGPPGVIAGGILGGAFGGGTGYLVIVIVDDDFANMGASFWFSGKATVDGLNPFGRPMITVRARTLNTAMAEVDNRLGENDYIDELRIVGHGGQRDFFFPDGSDFSRLRGFGVKKIRFNSCTEARSDAAQNKLAVIARQSGAKVSGNTGGVAIFANGNWFTFNPDGSYYDDNDWGDFIARQYGGIFYHIFGQYSDVANRPKSVE